MKKWLVILTLTLLLTGCDKKQETDAKEESPKQTSVESVADATEETEEIEESVAQTEESKEAIEESTEPVVESEEATEEVVESVESTETTENEEVKEEETLSQEGLQKAEFYFPNSNVEEIPEELLAGMSAGNLWVAKNEIYARHGRIFEDPVLNAYFLGCSWYVPEIQPEDFDETMLNPIERSNIQNIQIAEAQALGDLSIEDRLTVLADADLDKAFFAYTEDGDMYYYRKDRYGFISTLPVEKFSDLTNIHRIKTYRRAPGEVPSPCLITESGEVYWLNITYDESEKMTIERFEALGDYQVEDILYYIGGEKCSIRVLLKDGSTISLEGEGWDSGNQTGEKELETETNTEADKNVIPTSDLFVLKCGIDDLFYAYIEDGFLYYYQTDESFIYTESDKVRKMVKLEGLDNIKRMKLFNRGSGVDLYPCLITEAGEVYWVNNTYMFDREKVCVERFEFLKDYQVEDILSYSGEWRHKVEVLLKDGSIIYLESEPWG